MRTPPVGLLLLVFIEQVVFKRATVQTEGHHFSSRQGCLEHISEEEFVHHACTGAPDPAPSPSPTTGSSEGTADLTWTGGQLAPASRANLKMIGEKPGLNAVVYADLAELTYEDWPLDGGA
jgi:hypothetical protein